MDIMTEVNYLAVLVLSLVPMIIGMAWYAPSFLGNKWMEAAGMTAQDVEDAKKKGMAKPMF